MRRHLSAKGRLILFIATSLLIFVPLLLSSRPKLADAQVTVSYTEKQFIQDLAPLAQQYGQAYGIRPSVLLAQASLETNYGRTLLATKYNNLYHLLALEGKDHVKLKLDKKGDLVYYQVYADWTASLADYLGRLSAGQIGDQDLYERLATAEDYKQASTALILGGYTTDSHYADQLVEIIDKHDLTQYDGEE